MRFSIFKIVTLAAVFVGCQSRHDVPVTEIRREGIHDFTTNCSTTCEVHNAVMSPKVVDLEFGMRKVTDTEASVISTRR